MEFISAHFSIKFPRQMKIRRYANEIEDILSDQYGSPQVFSVPDDFASDVPRLIFISNGNHSQITISQMAIDFSVNFDNGFTTNFKKTREYLSGKIDKILEILKNIGVDKYYFCGITYDYSIDLGEESPRDYMEQEIGELGSSLSGEFYDGSWSKTYIENGCYINERFGIGRKVNGAENIVPDLFTLANGKITEERIIVTIDINDRLRYVQEGVAIDINKSRKCINNITDMMDGMLSGRDSERSYD